MWILKVSVDVNTKNLGVIAVKIENICTTVDLNYNTVLFFGLKTLPSWAIWSPENSQYSFAVEFIEKSLIKILIHPQNPIESFLADLENYNEITDDLTFYIVIF